MGKTEVENFLSFLGNERQSSKSTQRTALNALIFLYREFLEKDLGKFSLTFQKNIGEYLSFSQPRKHLESSSKCKELQN